jgi:hypothetical protein
MRPTDNSSKECSVRPRQHLPPESLGEQQRTRAVHVTLTLQSAHTQFPVGTSKKRPRVTARECADTISLRIRRYCMMGVLRWPYLSTPEGTKA